MCKWKGTKKVIIASLRHFKKKGPFYQAKIFFRGQVQQQYPQRSPLFHHSHGSPCKIVIILWNSMNFLYHYCPQWKLAPVFEVSLTQCSRLLEWSCPGQPAINMWFWFGLDWHTFFHDPLKKQEVRGTKPQNFPDSNFLRAKGEECKTVSGYKPKKRVFASHKFAKECESIINVIQ